MTQPNSPQDSSAKHLHCANEECTAKYPEPMYNIAFSGQVAGVASHPMWVCIKHIPSDQPLPVGLHGEEWKKAGRK